MHLPCLLIVLLALGSGADLRAQAPIRFAETSTINFVVGDTTPIRVLVQSIRGATLRLDSAHVYFPGDPGPNVTVSIPSPQLRRGQVAPVVLRLTSAPTVEGTGLLVIAADTYVISRSIQVAKSAPKTLVAQWVTLQSMVCWGWMPGCHPAALPFLVRDTAYGVLIRKTKDNASVDGLAQVVATERDTSRVLTVTGLDGPGTYAGTLTVGGASVALTVLARHWVGWLVVALSVGVLMGLWLTHYAGVRRTLWDLRARSDELDQRIQALGNVGGLTPDPVRAGGRKVRALRGVEALRSAAFRNLEGQPAYDAALAELTALEEAVDAWPTLGPRLTGLNMALSSAATALSKSSSPPVHGGMRRMEPRIMAWGRALVASRTVPVDDAVELARRLDEAAAALELLVLLNQAAETARQWIAALRAVPLTDAQELAKLTEAERTLSEAWWELWDSADPAVLTARQTQADLTQVEKLLSQLNFRLASQARADKMAFELTAAFENGGSPAAAGTPQDIDAKSSRLARLWAALGKRFQVRRWRRLIAVWDVIFLLLAIVLAILTGLKQLYFDGAFWGTAGDYVTAILWGFGVKVVVDLTIASVTSFFGVRSGAPRAPAAPPGIAVPSV